MFTSAREALTMSRPILWHLSISHYSEKVRWALDYKGVEHERRAPFPGYHMALALGLTKGRHYTLPVLELDGKRIGDSTAIIAALEERFPDPPLYPAAGQDRQRALELEDWFDEHLGPQIRRFAFNALRGDRKTFDDIAARQAPKAMSRLKGAVGGYARAFTAVRFGAASEGGAERARQLTLVALDRLESQLNGRDYLVGDAFTVADLTAAALFYPLVLPPEGPLQLPDSAAANEFTDSLAQRPGVEWVREMFRRHRRKRQAAQPPSAREETPQLNPT
jgi:glutathione S-transferase